MRETLPIAIVDRIEQQAIAGGLVVLLDEMAGRGAAKAVVAGALSGGDAA